MTYPDIYAVRQKFAQECEVDVRGAVKRELQRVFGSTTVKPGARIAVSVGSRGIANIAVIIRAVVDALKSLGAEPFIFPAMGSHGGGTAEGQARVLEHYGVTDVAMGCPIKSSMATVEIGRSQEGVPVFLDKYASEADHLVVVNRVKAHTDFKGEIESGIMKMLLIGVGKHEGAKMYHRAFVNYGFDRIVQSIARVAIERAKVLFAVAIVENGNGETGLIRGVLPHEIVDSERVLLRKAKELSAKLPFENIDVLIVDEMGKNVSGAGLDTNVIGRFCNTFAAEPEKRLIKRIYVRGLTPESLGNATGCGLADFVLKKLVDGMDPAATATNCLTGGNPEKGRLPIVCESDRQAMDYCLATIGLVPAKDVRLIRIQNTLCLSEMDISQALAREIDGRPDLEVLAGPAPLKFDASGMLGSMMAQRLKNGTD